MHTSTYQKMSYKYRSNDGQINVNAQSLMLNGVPIGPGGGVGDATTLLLKNWASPNPIGSTAPSTGAFTTLTATQITTPTLNATAALTTSQVTNLNASLLQFGDWRSPVGSSIRLV